jgi:hypothetical protein
MEQSFTLTMLKVLAVVLVGAMGLILSLLEVSPVDADLPAPPDFPGRQFEVVVNLFDA